MYAEIIQRTLRVPEPGGEPGDGSVGTRRLDAALLTEGFALTAELRTHLEGLREQDVVAVSVPLLDAVRTLVGDHVRHNIYFQDFPENVPDTVDFWVECLVDALRSSQARIRVVDGGLDLLSLPRYGRLQHTYAELAAARDAFVPSAKDRLTLLHLGDTLEQEAAALFRDLAVAPIPLSRADRALLAVLATETAPALEDGARIPIRENRSLINVALMGAGREPVVDTVTDVLRLAQALSGGDPTLTEPARLRSFTRRERRLLMAALDRVVADNEGKLGDVVRHVQGWKRLGEGLHPHEYPRFPHAREVFAVARGEREVRTFDARVEAAFLDGDLERAVHVLSTAPGMFARALGRLLSAGGDDIAPLVTERLRAVGEGVSGRVLVAAREELTNRTTAGGVRLFANRSARAWAVEDTREPLPVAMARPVLDALDELLAARLPTQELLLVDPAVRTVAVPRSAKAESRGFGILPRGTVTPVEGDRVRFFVHWREGARVTDLDLSVLLLGEDFTPTGQVSWTNLAETGVVHSGDLVQAPGPEGATEMIDLDLEGVAAAHVVPQVHVYAGGGFDSLPEAFFGYMVRDDGQEGMPFDPRTVRIRSDLEGEARVVLPVVFGRTGTGWVARWLHLGLRGLSAANRVEATGVSVPEQVRALVERRHLTVGELLDMVDSGEVRDYTGPPSAEEVAGRRVRYVGLERPEGLPEEVEVITRAELPELLTDPERGAVQDTKIA